MGTTLENPTSSTREPEGSTAVVEREAAAQLLENANLEDGEQGLLAHSALEEGSPRE